MEFAPTAAQRALIDEARAFTGDLRDRFGDEPTMTRDVWRFWGKDGWLGACLAGERGGRGASALSAVLAFEAMGRAGVSRSQLFAVGAHLFGCAMGIARHGSEAQQASLLPRLASGEAVGALAFSEPSGGSGLDSCETRIKQAREGYVLNGRKTLITNGAEADVFVAMARMASLPAPLDLSIILLGRDTPGLEVAPIEGVTGLAGTVPAEIAMTGCVVGKDSLLGSPGGGMAILLGIMQCERSCILGGLLGALERDLVAVTGHLAGRQATEHQSVTHALAAIRARIEAARWLMYRAAWGVDCGDRNGMHAAMGKLTVGTTLVECTLALAELAAGEAWKGGLGLNRAIADVTGTLSASGTRHVQLNLIGARLERE